MAVISLGRRLPAASSGLPAGIGRGAAPAPPRAPRPLLGLAPGGGCHAPERCRPAGGLLPHLFTLASMAPGKTPGRIGGLFSVALSTGRPVRVLPGTLPRWSPDFPQAGFPRPATARPSGAAHLYFTRIPGCRPMARWRPAEGPPGSSPGPRSPPRRPPSRPGGSPPERAGSGHKPAG